MLPIIGVPATIHRGLAPYRDLFCRAEGFEHVARYVTGRSSVPIRRCRSAAFCTVWTVQSRVPCMTTAHRSVWMEA